MATHSSILGWRIPRTEKPGWLQSKGLQWVRYYWSNLACTHTCITEPPCSTSATWRTLQINYTLIFKPELLRQMGLRGSDCRRGKQKCTQDHQSTHPVYKTSGGKVLYFDGDVGYMTQSFLKTGVSWTHHICAIQHIWIIPQFKIQLLIKGL